MNDRESSFDDQTALAGEADGCRLSTSKSLGPAPSADVDIRGSACTLVIPRVAAANDLTINPDLAQVRRQAEPPLLA